MNIGAVSLTLSLALDGTWVDIAARAIAGEASWPPPPELQALKRRFRHATIVDAAMRDLLGGGTEREAGEGLLIVADVGSTRDSGDVIGRNTLRELLQAAGDGFIHVAGGADLTSFVLATGLAIELDVTLYPLTGGASAERVGPGNGFRRLHVHPHDDGRLTTTWRRE